MLPTWPPRPGDVLYVEELIDVIDHLRLSNRVEVSSTPLSDGTVMITTTAIGYVSISVLQFDAES